MTTELFAPLIRKEHFRAELQRLAEGWPGCGCSDCQELYKTLDHSKYGARVSYSGDVVIFGEDPKLHRDTVPAVTREEVSTVMSQRVTAKNRARTALDDAILGLSGQGLGCRAIADQLFAQGLGDYSYRTIARRMKRAEANEAK